MKKNRGTVLASLGQIKDIFSVLIQAIPSTLTSEAAQKIIGNKGRLIKGLQRIFQEIIGATGYDELLAEWQKLYLADGIELDVSNLKIPEKKEGFDRLLVIPKGLTIQQAYDNCAKQFRCWKYIYKNLDEAVPKNDRDPANGSYAIWVRDRVEADEELKNLSANDLDGKNISGETILERFQHERKYCEETGKHLDNTNVTLCSGSRGSVGGVPRVDWGGGGMSVRYYSPDVANGHLRARAAVSA